MYAIHPTTEGVVRQLAARWAEPTPVKPWEMPRAIEAPAVARDDDQGDDDMPNGIENFEAVY